MGINDDQWPFPVDDGSINGFRPLWDYQENTGDLKQKFFYEMKLKDTELRWKEELRWKDEELRRKEEENNNLTQLLRLTTQERDIAQDEMQTLLNKIAHQNNAGDHFYAASPTPLPIGSPPLVRPMRDSSGITESNSPSETNNNYQSIVSSPVDHFDTVTSPNMSNLVNIADHFVGTPYFGMESSLISLPKNDQGSLIIDAIAMERPLPEKGKLLQALQAATCATPLLETLLMTGYLPEWRNPPPSLPFQVQVPPLTFRGCANLQHERSRGGACVSVNSANICDVRKPLPGGRGNNYKALGAKRQMTQ